MTHGQIEPDMIDLAVVICLEIQRSAAPAGEFSQRQAQYVNKVKLGHIDVTEVKGRRCRHRFGPLNGIEIQSYRRHRLILSQFGRHGDPTEAFCPSGNELHVLHAKHEPLFMLGQQDVDLRLPDRNTIRPGVELQAIENARVDVSLGVDFDVEDRTLDLHPADSPSPEEVDRRQLGAYHRRAKHYASRTGGKAFGRIDLEVSQFEPVIPAQ